MAKKILIIEDNFQTSKILKSKLESVGYHVTQIALGSEGFDAACALLPDLVILDLLLAGSTDGMWVLKELKKNAKTSKIPVLVLTNLDNQKKETDKLKADGYLVKANTSLTQIMAAANQLLK